MQPSEQTATDIIKKHYGVEAISATRFPTGLHHYVYECLLPNGESVVVRTTTPSEKPAMTGAFQLNHQLRDLGIPLPRVYFYDLECKFPYLILERFRGQDIGYVIQSLTNAALECIAERLMGMQAAVAKTPSCGRFGYAADPDAAPYTCWTDALRASLKRSRTHITQSGVVDVQYVSRVEAWLEKLAPELNRQAAIPFLHDITTKNVIVDNGQLSGIVDVDSLCYGDPLFQVALTKMALLSDNSPLDYIHFVLKHCGAYSEQKLFLYTAVCCVGFMGEIGQAFNGLNESVSADRKTHLESVFARIIKNYK
ncbi:MAG: phosphotransferase family protein [Bdellovibrionales bacterium]